MRWVVKSPAYPSAAIPVDNELHAMKLLEQFRAIASHHQARVVWEYGTYDPSEPGSYRKVGPRF